MLTDTSIWVLLSATGTVVAVLVALVVFFLVSRWHSAITSRLLLVMAVLLSVGLTLFATATSVKSWGTEPQNWITNGRILIAPVIVAVVALVVYLLAWKKRQQFRLGKSRHFDLGGGTRRR